jgi:ribosomal protein S18 acetylase RimI-like enzyme
MTGLKWEIRPYRIEDESGVISLWDRCELTRPWNDPKKDIERKIHVSPDLFLVASTGLGIVGTIMIGYDGHRGSINYLAVDLKYRRNGLGSELVSRAERLLSDLDCPKINIQIRTENSVVVAFYRSIGYEAYNVIDMAKRLD